MHIYNIKNAPEKLKKIESNFNRGNYANCGNGNYADCKFFH
jgi:hypothetical protein